MNKERPAFVHLRRAGPAADKVPAFAVPATATALYAEVAMSCAHNSAGSDFLTSLLLADDDDLREVVEEFVAGLSDRIHEIRRALDEPDWDRVVMLAHRLKGAAGSYGYPDISQLCAEMEQNAGSQQVDALESEIEELTSLTAAARRGLARIP